MMIQRAFLFLLPLTLCACTPVMVKKQQAFDFSHVGRIDLEITTHNPDALPPGSTQQVIKNLQQWSYPLGAEVDEAVTHRLKARVDKVTYGSTPTGLTFTAGNSDPRAIDFQKMDVLPITCTLTALADPNQTNEIGMDFTATEADRRAFDPEKLTDHISTVCFNLLREVNWPLPEKKASSQTEQSSWIPEVRIETIETPASSVSTVSPVSPEQSTTSNTSTKPIEVSPVIKEMPRKDMVIHNQGTPVILHFGPERE